MSTERIVDFVPDRLAAPFALRCAALFIDYMVLLVMPVTWLVLARFLSDAGVPDAIGKTVWSIGILLFILDCIVLPIIFDGRSLGKMAVGLRVVAKDGSRARAATILLRNTVGYALTLITGGLGFLAGALSPAGTTLHDLLAGTLVVRGRRKPV